MDSGPSWGGRVLSQKTAVYRVLKGLTKSERHEWCVAAPYSTYKSVGRSFGRLALPHLRPYPHHTSLKLAKTNSLTLAEVVIADSACDADHLRQDIADKKALAVIPNNPSHALKYLLDKHLCVQRHLVECCFSKLKQFRRVVTRFEKTTQNYRTVVTLAAIVLWMR